MKTYTNDYNYYTRQSPCFLTLGLTELPLFDLDASIAYFQTAAETASTLVWFSTLFRNHRVAGGGPKGPSCRPTCDECDQRGYVHDLIQKNLTQSPYHKIGRM